MKSLNKDLLNGSRVVGGETKYTYPRLIFTNTD